MTDEGDVVCDGGRIEEDGNEKAKFMKQTLAFNKKVKRISAQNQRQNY